MGEREDKRTEVDLGMITPVEVELSRLEEAFSGRVPNSELLGNYGIGEGETVSPAVARVLAFVELTDRYRQEAERAESAIKEAQGQMATQLSQLGSTVVFRGVSKGNARRDIESIYKTTISLNKGRVAEAQVNMRQVFYRGVFDFFSRQDSKAPGGRPLVIGNLPGILDEIQESLAKVGKDEQAFTKYDPIGYFFDSLGEYMRDTYDTGLFSRYSYRNSEDLVGTGDDCQVLATTLSFISRSEAVAYSHEVAEHLRKLGQSHLVFLRNRASVPSARIKETYPILGLAYDIFTAGAYVGDMRVISETVRFVDDHFSDLIGSTTLKEEQEALIDRQVDLQLLAAGGIDKDMLATLGHSMSRDIQGAGYMTKAEIAKFVVRPELRMVSGLSGLRELKNLTGAQLGGSIFVRKVTIALERRFQNACQILGNDLVEKMNAVYIAAMGLPRSEILPDLGIEVDLSMFCEQTKGLVGSLIKRDGSGLLTSERMVLAPGSVTMEERMGVLVGLVERYRDRPNKLIQEFFNLYLHTFLADYGKDKERVEKENDFLWRGVLDNLVWFVSPRGDRFSINRDSQLSQWGIHAILFQVDRNFPREHKVLIRFEGIDYDFEFWLTTGRYIMVRDHNAWPADAEFRQTFLNIILRRLYFITSGILKEERQDNKQAEEVDGRVVDFRRAHYNTLRAPRYKMEMRGLVKAHAEKILKIYGIDIERETRRRWELGTLNRKHFLTFVEEVAMKDWAFTPNEIPFDPSLIKISL